MKLFLLIKDNIWVQIKIFPIVKTVFHRSQQKLYFLFSEFTNNPWKTEVHGFNKCKQKKKKKFIFSKNTLK